MSLVAYDSSEGSSEDEGPAEQKKDEPPQENVSKLLTSLPAPKGQPNFAAISSLLSKRDKNGKAIISMPVAPDSDSEEDRPPAKRKKEPQQAPVGKSALMSMLPQPKNLFQKAKISTGEPSGPSITVEEGEALRSRNRNMPTKKKAAPSLTPYVLGKKKEPTPVDTSRKAPAAKKSKEVDEDDGDEDSAPFFSFHSAKDDEKLLAQYSDLPPVTTSAPTEYAMTADDRAPEQQAWAAGGVASATTGPYEPAVGPVADYSYGAAVTDDQYAVTGPSLQPAFEYDDEHHSSAGAAASAVADPAPYASSAASSQAVPGSISDLLNDEQFKRLSRGGKRSKQDMAAIASSMVEFDENERSISYNSLPSKYLSEEKVVRTPQSQQPSRSQKNKHQITYLAFQAKERELELQNQWSENRQTRKQTQSKYGF